MRGPSGPLSGRHSRRVSAVHTPRSYRRTRRTVVVLLWFSTAVGRFGGERIGPQRDRPGCSREHRQAGGVSLGARAFWPAFRKTQPARQRRPHPTVVPLHPAVAASRRVFLAAFGGSGPEGPRTQRTVVALLWFSTAVGTGSGHTTSGARTYSSPDTSIGDWPPPQAPSASNGLHERKPKRQRAPGMAFPRLPPSPG